MKREKIIIFIGVLLILMAGLPILKPVVSVESLAVTEVLLIALFFLFFYRFGKTAFGRDFSKHLIFFSVWMLIVESAAVFILFFDPLGSGLMVFLTLVLALIFASAAFRFAFGKKGVTGEILFSEKDSAAVKIQFELFAGLNSGKYVVKADKKYKKGEIVRVELERKWFKKVPSYISGKAKK